MASDTRTETRPTGRHRLLRPLTITAAFIVPAFVVRLSGLHPDPVVSLVVYGAAVVAASFLLAWAAEAAQIDVSGGLAIAVLALIAVLPEYAVDLYYAYTAGHDPDYVQYAAANMTGSNRLLMGIGWPIVVLVEPVRREQVAGGKRPTAHQRAWPRPRQPGRTRLPADRRHHRLRDARDRADPPGARRRAAGLVRPVPLQADPGRRRGARADRRRRRDRRVARPRRGASPSSRCSSLAAAVILACAEPFAESLIGAGTELGIDRFLLVQWLAPLASEAPEFIIAIIFATRGKGTAAIATLISSKVNQWTLLMGSLPIAYLAGGGGTSLVLDGRQIEEVLLTATQTMMGVALILALRFHRCTAWALLALFTGAVPDHLDPGQADPVRGVRRGRRRRR